MLKVWNVIITDVINESYREGILLSLIRLWTLKDVWEGISCCTCGTDLQVQYSGKHSGTSQKCQCRRRCCLRIICGCSWHSCYLTDVHTFFLIVLHRLVVICPIASRILYAKSTCMGYVCRISLDLVCAMKKVWTIHCSHVSVMCNVRALYVNGNERHSWHQVRTV